MTLRGFLTFLVLTVPIPAWTLVYEQNAGQADPKALFVARAPGYSLHLTADGAEFLFPSSTLRLRLESAEIRPVDCLPGVTHYLVGKPDRWHTGIQGFRAVRYAGIAPGVDVLFYGDHQQASWEYTFSTLAPSADTTLIFEGASRTWVEASGDLRIEAGGEMLRVARPRAYQTIQGDRHSAQARYEVIRPGRVRLHSTWPDRTLPLVIDPVLSRVTKLGGSAADTIFSVAAGSHGSVYLAGETRSTDIPGAVGQPPSGSNTQIMLMKLDAAGKVEYTVLAGGSGDDAAYGVAVDTSGNVHLTGRTSSADFPVTRGAYKASKGGGWDAFYLSLSPDGKAVRAATYIGGSGEEKGQAIAVDRTGSVYIAGSTLSGGFAATTGRRRGISDAFIAKIAAGTAQCSYITALGGSREDYANALSLDTAGDVWVTGQTNSPDFPVTAKAVQREKRGLWDAFVVKLAASTGHLQYATFLGGGPDSRTRGIDNGLAISVDPKDSVWVAGESDSTGFPVTGQALQPANPGGRRGFLTRLDDGATRIGYSTYLGGSGESTARTLVTGAMGWVVVAGTSASKDFPPARNRVTDDVGAGNVFTLVLDRDRGDIVCAARLGTSGDDRPGGAAILTNGAIAIAGSIPAPGLGSPAKGGVGHSYFATLQCGEKEQQ